MFGIWRIEREQAARWWRHYHFSAVASEGNEKFRLECAWAEGLYTLTISTMSHCSDDLLFARLMFTDADCGKYVRQVMRIAHSDIRQRLERLDRLHRRAVIGIGQVCRKK